MASITLDVEIEEFYDDDILNEFIERLKDGCYSKSELKEVVRYLSANKFVENNTMDEEMKMDIVLQLYEKMSLSELQSLIK